MSQFKKQSPHQLVKEQFGSKQELAKQLLDKLDRPYEDESDDEFERRIRTASNKKLLRLHAAYETLERDFGDKGGLVDAIVKLQAGSGKEDGVFRSKLETYRVTRLLDLHRSLKASAN